jgi:hypothetical protein
MVMNWHTGLEIGADPAYGGTRFFNGNQPIYGSEIMSVGRGDSNIRIANTLFVPYIADSNNTGFYLDPASTTNMNYVIAQTTFRLDRANNSGFFAMNNSSTWWGVMGNVGVNDWRLGYGTPDGGIQGWNLRWDNGSTAWAQSFQSNIIYDAQDTTYYTDLNGGSYVRGMFEVAGGHGNSTFRLTARGNEMGTGTPSYLQMWVSEPGVTWNSGGFGFNVQNNGGSPSGFGRINTGQGQAYMRFDPSGDWYFYNTNTSGTRFSAMDLYASNYIFVHNYLQAGNSLRAPIFYDSNNTGYYVDGASDSQFNTGTCQGRMRYSNYLVSNNEGGLMGNYNSTGTASKLIWTIGESWPIGNMYGIGYEYVGSSFLPGDPHVIAIRHNGSTNTRLQMNGGIFTNGAIFSSNAMYTPAFYDSNDTGFVLDPNGTSNLSRFTQRTHAAMNRGFHWITPRFDYTGDVNYWTGTFGWGTSAGNWDNAWRAGFAGWDIWGGGTGHPQGGGYIHAQGIVSGQHLVTSDGGAAYGWMMVGAGDATANRYWARGKWGGGVSGWKEFAMYGGGGSGDLRANVFYDSDDTGYYLDPNTTSDQALRIRGGALHGPNPTWGAYLWVGTNGRPNGWASVAATNGNLHLDCQNGYETYINHYSGNRTYTYELRSTFIYDYNNTGYYLNMDSVSQLHYVLVDNWIRPQGCTGLYLQSYDKGLWSPECAGNPYGTISSYGSGRNGWYGWGIHNRFCFMSTLGDNVGVHDNNRGWVWYMSGADLNLYWAGQDIASMRSHGVYAHRDVRASIYYDHDTGWYGDFNSTSRFNYIINNNIYCYDWIFAQGNIIAYYSDERLKTKIGNIENALEKVSQLNGFYYVNNELANSVGYTDTKVQLGLSAQEVQRILPEIVHLAPFDTDIDSETREIKGSKSGENYLTIDYDKLVPLLVEAIKEQQTIIDKQNNEISEIKEMLKTLLNNKQ